MNALLFASVLVLVGCGGATPSGASGDPPDSGGPSAGGAPVTAESGSGGLSQGSGGAAEQGNGGAPGAGGQVTGAGGLAAGAGGKLGAGGKASSGGAVGSGGAENGDAGQVADGGGSGGAPGAGGASTCECTSGPCCDGCNFRWASWQCESGDTSSACAGLNLLACNRSGYYATDVLHETHQRYCSGSSSLCDGRETGNEVVERCVNRGLVCHPGAGNTASCVACPTP